jgi:hypothetical protein
MDDYSHKKWSFFVKQKSMVGEVMLSVTEQLSGLKMTTKYLRCDNAGENGKYLQEVCIELGIKPEFTAPNTPQQNGVAERAFAVIKDGAVAMLRGAKLTNKWCGQLWAEAVSMQTYLRNRIPSAGENKSPEELFSGQATKHGHLPEFGWIGYIMIQDKYVRKFQDKAVVGVFLGYPEDHSTQKYRLYNTKKRRVVMSRDIKWATWHGTANITLNLPMFRTERSHGDRVPEQLESMFSKDKFVTEQEDLQDASDPLEPISIEKWMQRKTLPKIVMPKKKMKMMRKIRIYWV